MPVLEKVKEVKEVKETRQQKFFTVAKKEDVVAEVFKQTNYSKQFAGIAVNVTLEAIIGLLKQGLEIDVENLGSFRKATDPDGKQVFVFKPIG